MRLINESITFEMWLEISNSFRYQTPLTMRWNITLQHIWDLPHKRNVTVWKHSLSILNFKNFPSSSILWQNSPSVSEHFCYLLELIFHTFLKKGCITRKFLKQNGIPEIFCISCRTIFRVRVATYFIWMLEIRRPRDIFSEKRHENLDSDCPDLIYQNSMGLSHAIFPRTKFLL